jgi:Plasmid pRiA4b ORF-3-like protein
MSDRDPLEDWVFHTQLEPTFERRASQDLQQDLNKLEQWLAAPPAGKRREVPRVRGARWDLSARLEPRDITRVQDLYRRLVLETGTGKSYAEEALLNMLALALDPSTIPFFMDMLDYAPPRDKLSARRREMSLAALALLVYRRDEPAALAALVEATHHKNPAIRALAVHYLRCVFVGVDEIIFGEPGDDQPSLIGEDEDIDQLPEPSEPPELRRPIPPDILERLSKIATDDPAFEPRFMARQLLSDAGAAVPLDHPDGAYAFKVKLRRLAGMYRTIAMHSTDTLDDLHMAIQDAIKWDADHLYSFFLNNKRYDQRYGFSSPWDSDNPPWADEVQIGELGLPLKHKFMYYFDYGDSHEFEVEVVGIEPQAVPGDYPRVIESQGAAPRQYHYADEDEWDEEDDLDDGEDV